MMNFQKVICFSLIYSAFSFGCRSDSEGASDTLGAQNKKNGVAPEASNSNAKLPPPTAGIKRWKDEGTMEIICEPPADPSAKTPSFQDIYAGAGNMPGYPIPCESGKLSFEAFSRIQDLNTLLNHPVCEKRGKLRIKMHQKCAIAGQLAPETLKMLDPTWFKKSFVTIDKVTGDERRFIIGLVEKDLSKGEVLEP